MHRSNITNTQGIIRGKEDFLQICLKNTEPRAHSRKKGGLEQMGDPITIEWHMQWAMGSRLMGTY